jgi:hypothetical protein
MKLCYIIPKYNGFLAERFWKEIWNFVVNFLFLYDIRLDLFVHFSDQTLMFLASYLADIFEKVSELNLSLQEKGTNILILNSKHQAFQQKLSSWSKGSERGCTDMFTCINIFLITNDISVSTSIKRVIFNHISDLQSFFTNIFQI